MSGYAESNDSTGLIEKEKSRSPGNLTTSTVLPSSTVMFETRILGNNPAVTNKSGANLSSTDKLLNRIYPYLGGEVTEALIDNRENYLEQNFIVVCELKNREIAERVLTELMAEINPNTEGGQKQYIQMYQPDDITSIPVYSTPFKEFRTSLFADWGLEGNDSLFTFYDNYLIAGSSFTTISRFLHDNILNNTFINDIDYRDFEIDYLYSRSSSVVWLK